MEVPVFVVELFKLLNVERVRFSLDHLKRGQRWNYWNDWNGPIRWWWFTLPADLNELSFRRFGNSRNVEVASGAELLNVERALPLTFETIGTSRSG